jgi:rRNA biogenesis protein RRP5
MMKFGQQEFKIGSPERGRTLFEGLLGAYPKRMDLWNIYLDMEIKVCDIDLCRRLFERVLIQKWSTKKMQFLFKKYSQFEKAHGSPEGVQHVVSSAKRYLESLHP